MFWVVVVFVGVTALTYGLLTVKLDEVQVQRRLDRAVYSPLAGGEAKP